MAQAVDQCRSLASSVRRLAVEMVYRAKASHIGSSLSMVDILAVLYGAILRVDPRQPDRPERDRLLVSKGHAAAAVYAVLAESGFFPKEWLNDYCQEGSLLLGHVSHYVPGVEASTGSLGHGLSMGCGLALAAKREGKAYRTFVLLSDGELDEGSNWEAILFAPHHHLDNLVAIIDYNKIQSLGTVAEVLNLEPLADKFRAFGWETMEVDGHDCDQLHASLCKVATKPIALIAHTLKGKGVSYMEDTLTWHYKSPDAAQLKQALQEMGVPP